MAKLEQKLFGAMEPNARLEEENVRLRAEVERLGAGGGLRQTVVGQHPDLREMENGGVKHTVDFRQIYATILERRLGIPSQQVLSASFEPLPILV